MNIEPEILELFSGLERKTDFDRWPDWIFFFSNEKCFFEYNLNFGRLLCHDSQVWNKISAAKGLDYFKTQRVIKNLVEQHFKLREVTPQTSTYRCISTVEQHFKLREVTPIKENEQTTRKVEDHFKLDGFDKNEYKEAAIEKVDKPLRIKKQTS